jgi:hypothetical protein
MCAPPGKEVKGWNVNFGLHGTVKILISQEKPKSGFAGVNKSFIS